MRILVPREQKTLTILEGAVPPICHETSIIYGESDSNLNRQMAALVERENGDVLLNVSFMIVCEP